MSIDFLPIVLDQDKTRGIIRKGEQIASMINNIPPPPNYNFTVGSIERDLRDNDTIIIRKIVSKGFKNILSFLKNIQYKIKVYTNIIKSQNTNIENEQILFNLNKKLSELLDSSRNIKHYFNISREEKFKDYQLNNLRLAKSHLQNAYNIKDDLEEQILINDIDNVIQNSLKSRLGNLETGLRHRNEVKYLEERLSNLGRGFRKKRRKTKKKQRIKKRRKTRTMRKKKRKKTRTMRRKNN